MPTATSFRLAWLPVIGVSGLAVAVAFLGVAALRPWGADMTDLPSMTPRPVVMSDGSAFYAQIHEVTTGEWNRCADAGACKLRLRPPSGQTDTSWPATGLSLIDVTEYLKWLNETSGHEFRLPTRAEWRRMAADVLPDAPDPIFTDPNLTWASSYLVEGLVDRRLRPSGSWSESPEGVVDLDGNVWEWTQDCFRGEGFARGARCAAYHVGGEHDAVIPYLVRDPARGGCAVGSPPAHLGFRLVSDDPPPF